MSRHVAAALVRTAPAVLLVTLVACATPDRAEPAKAPMISLESARKSMKWDEAAEPVKIAGPLYFVGTRGLASWLIVTTEGHILLNTTMPQGGPMIEASIRKLGFKPEEIRILLTGHAHVDHVGGHAYIQKLSGARVAMMAEEVDLIESGGKSDFLYGAEPEFAFEPVKVDRVLSDRETIRLGDVALTTHRTAGHTRGSTTFAMKINEDGKTWNVLFPGSASINPGYRLLKDPSYPGIADDYRRTVDFLETMEPDVSLDMHINVADFEARRARAPVEGVGAWVNAEEYRKWVTSVREKLDSALAAERDADSGAGGG